MRFKKNAKGVKELWFEGHAYQRWTSSLRRKTPETEALWVCARSPYGENCKGYVTTDFQYKNILSLKVHCHEPADASASFKSKSSLPDREAEIDFILNNKGGKKLIHDGYMYTKKYDMDNAIKWECSRRTLLKCRGTVTTDLECTKIERCHVHTHPASNHAIEAARAKIELKKVASLAHDTEFLPRDIVELTLSKISTEAQKEAGKADSNQRLVRRYRQKAAPQKSELEAEKSAIFKMAETVVKKWEKFEEKWSRFERKQNKSLSRYKPY